jgi:hypothetical protein
MGRKGEVCGAVTGGTMDLVRMALAVTKAVEG